MKTIPSWNLCWSVVALLFSCGPRSSPSPTGVDANASQNPTSPTDMSKDATVSLAPSCGDAFENGDETDIDCGGACMPCGIGKGCHHATDCLSKVCSAGICAAPSCSDMVQNGSEVGPDCGGSCTKGCPANTPCQLPIDCESGVCAELDTGKVCVSAACGDGVKNGQESDSDCGGSCPPCADAFHCLVASDCQSLVCGSGDAGFVCIPPSCNDGVKNQGEFAVDCLGPCGKCRTGQPCAADNGCQSGFCRSDMTCAVPSCVDHVQNGNESDADCGGATCSRCELTKRCVTDGDCQSNICRTVCVDSCHDDVRNNSESDLDCGGAGCPKCGADKLCSLDQDCISGSCINGLCTDPCTVGWWRFDEGTGTTARDSSGHSLNGVVNGATYKPGMVGSALSLNGTSYVAVPNTPSLNGLEAITLEGWFNPNDFVSDPMLVSKLGNFNLFVSADGLLSSTLPPLGSLGSATAGKWQHFALTYDGSLARLFLNGQVVGSGSRSGVLGSAGSGLEIGRGAPAAQYLSGLVDDIRILNCSRTPQQILDDATRVAWYRFDEGSGTKTANSSNGAPGTLTFGAGWGPGKTGRAVTLNGAGQYVGIPAGGPPAVSDFTVALWFNMVAPPPPPSDGNTVQRSVLVDLNGDGSGGALSAPLLAVDRQQTDGRFVINNFIFTPSGTIQSSAFIASPLGSWHHLALVRSGPNTATYYDGLSVSTTAGINAAVALSNPKRIGTFSLAVPAPGANYYFNGSVDQVLIYSRALSGAEIQALYTTP